MLLPLLFGLVSCEKITNMRYVDSPATGNLNYKVVDDSGRGISRVKVSVYLNDRFSDFTYLDNRFIVDSVRTNADGMAIFSDLLPGNYKVTTDSPVVNNIKYVPREIVQVVADKEKKKVMKVSDFYGNLKITMQSMTDHSTPLKDIQVVATPMPLNIAAANIKALIDGAYIQGTTNENGVVTLKIPSNIMYYITMYNPKSTSRSSWIYGIVIQKNADYSLIDYIY
jgi:hypothetical protein